MIQASSGEVPCGHLRGCGCTAYKGCCFDCPFLTCSLGLGRADYVEATNPIRQRVEEVASLRGRGLSVKETARTLGISPRTAYRRWRYAQKQGPP